MQTPLKRLAFTVACVALSAPRLAIGDLVYVTDNQRDVVSVIDTATKTVTGTIPVGPGIHPCGIALSPDGRTAYTANPEPNTVSVIDLTTFSSSNIDLECPRHACRPAGVIVNPDGRRLYAVSEEFGGRAITEIDLRTRAIGRTFRVSADGISGGCTKGTITADGRFLYLRVVQRSGFALAVIDTATGAEVARLQDRAFSSVAALPSPSALAATTNEGVAIIDGAAHEVERIIPLEQKAGSIAVSPDGSTAYAVGACIVSVVDLVEGVLRTVIPLESSCSVRDVIVTPDGTRVLIANLTRSSIIVIDAVREEIEKTVSITDGIGMLAAAPDSSTVYVANEREGLRYDYPAIHRNGALLRVDLHSDSETGFFLPAGPTALAVTSDGSQLWVVNAVNEEVVVVDSRRQRVESRIAVADPWRIAVSPGGDRVFVGNSRNDPGRISVIDRISRQVVDILQVAWYAAALAVAPDGSRLYAATRIDPDRDAVMIIDADALTPIASLAVDQAIARLVVAPGGERLYAALSEYGLNLLTGGVALIDLMSRNVTTVNASGGAAGLALSPDGESIYASIAHCCLSADPSPELLVIDAESQTARATIPFDDAGALVTTSAGDEIFMASGLGGRALAIDASTFATRAEVNVGVWPSDIAIAPEPPALTCDGDCDGDGVVTVDEIVALLSSALGLEGATACIDGPIAVDDVLRAVDRALYGC